MSVKLHKKPFNPFDTGHSVQKNLIQTMLAAKKSPDECASMLLHVCMEQMGEDPVSLHTVFAELFKKLKEQAPMAEAEAMKAEYEEALKELKNGPVRPATYVGQVKIGMDGNKPRAEIVTPDGIQRYPAFAPDMDAKTLMTGETVFLDAEGRVVLGTTSNVPQVGQEAKFMRKLPGTKFVELQNREEQFVTRAAQPLLDDIEGDSIKRGDRVIYCSRRQFAFRAVPEDEDRSYRFINQESVPNVVASRDIGKPHWSLTWLRKRTNILLNRKDLLEKFDIRPRLGLLMAGPSGTGKTLTIRAFLREFHEMLIKRTERDDLGTRVVRVKTSDLLSPWFGESDIKIDKLFSDVYKLGSTEVETADGELVKLPIVLILEECESLGRRRTDNDSSAVYDRVIGTLLQRLDDPTDDLGKLPLITIATSNRPDILDVAMWRRLANMVARFPRLDGEAFYAVLGKKIKSSYPLVSNNGHSKEMVRKALLDEVYSAFYSPNTEDSLIEITLRDGAKLQKSARHFFTGAIVEQGISQAIDRTAFAASESEDDGVGLSANLIVEALWRQVDNLVGNLTAHNVAEYVDLADGVHIADVRRLQASNGHFSTSMF